MVLISQPPYKTIVSVPRRRQNHFTKLGLGTSIRYVQYNSEPIGLDFWHLFRLKKYMYKIYELSVVPI